MKTIAFRLIDESNYDMGEENVSPDVMGEIVLRNGVVLIRPSGYGDCCSENGHGFPIDLELYEGKVWLTVWADINQEDPTHRIDMSGALESNRLEDES